MFISVTHSNCSIWPVTLTLTFEATLYVHPIIKMNTKKKKQGKDF